MIRNVLDMRLVERIFNAKSELEETEGVHLSVGVMVGHMFLGTALTAASG